MLELMKEPEDIHVLRLQVAQAARDYQANRMTWDSFIGEYGEYEDELIGEVVDLIEHEPKRGGFMGANEKEWAEYQQQVQHAISALVCDE